MDMDYLINEVYGGDRMKMFADVMCNSIPIPKLHEAVNRGDFRTVRLMIQNGADLNHQEPRLGFTPLFGAIISGNVRMLELLIREGANVNIVTKDKRTPLTVALTIDNMEAMRVLVENGADVHVKILEEQSLLHMAVEFGHTQMVDFLIERGVDVNIRGACNETPLHIAVNGGKTSIVQLLLSKGADVNLAAGNLWEPQDEKFKIGFSITPLILAAVGGHLDIGRILVNAKANVNARTTTMYTALYVVVKEGQLEFVKMLLKAGSDVNAQIDSGTTPLHVAVETNRYEIAQLLLKHKALVDLKDRVNGTTPLFLAVEKEREDFVKLLVEKGANVNAGNKSGVLPIHVAARTLNIKIAKVLLWNGSYYSVEAKAKSHSGSPAELAQRSGNAKLVAVLTLIGKLFNSVGKNDACKLESCVQAGAILNARNVSGRTALHYAVSNGNVIAVKTLIKSKADISAATNKGNLPLHIAVANENQEIIEILLKHAEELSFEKRNFIVNAKTTECGNSALHVAAKNNHLHTTKILVANGAIYNAKNKAGKSPVQLTTNETIKSLLLSAEKLFEAVKNDGFAVVKQILEEDNSAVNARDTDGGGTSLYWSVSKGNLDLTNVLLSNGADLRLVTNKGTTPLHIAASKGNMEMTKVLVAKVKMDNAEKANEFIDAATASGTVALHVASSLEIVKCLLEAGATFNVRNGEGKTASELSQDEDVCKLLKMTHQTFEDVKKGNNSWNNLKNYELKVIAGARNERGQTLLQVANAKIAGKLREKLNKIK